MNTHSYELPCHSEYKENADFGYKRSAAPQLYNSTYRQQPYGNMDNFMSDSRSMPPSLGMGSSSPLFDSPRSVNHTDIYRTNRVMDSPPASQHALVFSSEGVNFLPSSPPGPAHGPSEQFSQSIPQQTHTASHSTPIRRGTKRAFDLSNLGEFASSPPRPLSSGGLSLSEFLSPNKRICSSPITHPPESWGRSHGTEPSDPAESTELHTDYNITGLEFGFRIDARTGRVEVGLLSAGRSLPLPVPMQSLLDDESDDDYDSEPESRWNDECIGTGDAIDEFARLLAKSRVQRVEGRLRGTHKSSSSVKLDPNDCTFFNNVPSETDLPSSCPSTPNLMDSCLSRFNPTLSTPKGFPLALATPSYSTGLTP